MIVSGNGHCRMTCYYTEVKSSEKEILSEYPKWIYDGRSGKHRDRCRPGGDRRALRPRGRRRAADREPLILDAASELLDEVGYDHLRVQDVAERAHVGLATIYRRWSTKQELVIAAMSRAKAGT